MTRKVSLRYGVGFASLDADVERALDNWARWQRPRSGQSSRRVGSAEGRWAAGRGGSSSWSSVDKAVALRVERLVAQQLPPRAATLLRHHFVLGADYRATARILNVRWEQLAPELERAANLVGQHLVAGQQVPASRGNDESAAAQSTPSIPPVGRAGHR